MLDTRKAGLATLLASLAALLLLAAPASASYQRPFLEVFGSAAEPTFAGPRCWRWSRAGTCWWGTKPAKGMTRREKSAASSPTANRTPSPPSAPTSSTARDSGHLRLPADPLARLRQDAPERDRSQQLTAAKNQQIAVSPVSGDIFVTQLESNLVDIFSAEGQYLGQLTRAGTKKLVDPMGVAVDSSGAVYVSQNGNEISKFVPSADPPVNTDNKANFTIPSGYYVGHLALGSGPSAGKIFAAGSPGPAALSPVSPSR